MNRVVQNMQGTRDDRAPGGKPWSAWAREFSGSAREVCSAMPCSDDATHGSHVRDLRDGTEGIALLCPTHNHPTYQEPMRLKDRAPFVSLPRAAGAWAPAPAVAWLPEAPHFSPAVSDLLARSMLDSHERSGTGAGWAALGIGVLAAVVGAAVLATRN